MIRTESVRRARQTSWLAIELNSPLPFLEASEGEAAVDALTTYTGRFF